MNLSGKSSQDLALLQQGLSVTEAFASWPFAAMRKLLATARLGRYERGAFVQSEGVGEPEVLMVLSGHLMMSRLSASGSRASVAILGPGMLMGVARGLEPGDEALYDYHAHDGSVVAHMPAQVVLGILDAEPSLWKSMGRMLLKQQRQLSATLLHQLSGSVRRRLAATLSRLAQIYGVDDSARVLRLRLSQEDLAAMLQVTRQSINREMRVFEDMGLIRAEYGTVIVFDPTALRELGRASGEAA